MSMLFVATLKSDRDDVDSIMIIQIVHIADVYYFFSVDVGASAIEYIAASHPSDDHSFARVCILFFHFILFCFLSPHSHHHDLYL